MQRFWRHCFGAEIKFSYLSVKTWRGNLCFSLCPFFCCRFQSLAVRYGLNGLNIEVSDEAATSRGSPKDTGKMRKKDDSGDSGGPATRLRNQRRRGLSTNI